MQLTVVFASFTGVIYTFLSFLSEWKAFYNLLCKSGIDLNVKLNCGVIALFIATICSFCVFLFENSFVFNRSSSVCGFDGQDRPIKNLLVLDGNLRL
jgi:hypothetical protein